MADNEKSWYSKKDLFEMVQDLIHEIATLKTEMAQTSVLIRDYNGLRKEVAECKLALAQTVAASQAEEKAEGKADKLDARRLTIIIGMTAAATSLIGTVIPYIFSGLKLLIKG